MLRFLVFADLHYKKGMYAAGVEHLQAILDRAAREKVDFVAHLGDLCNDYAIVTVTDAGSITVEGSRTHWRYGIVPENLPSVCYPEISSR